MPELKINDSNKQVDVLAVTIGEKVYNIPLGNCLKVKDYRRLKNLKNNEDEVFSFLGEYIPEEVLGELSITDLSEIFKVWSEATQKASGQTLGES